MALVKVQVRVPCRRIVAGTIDDRSAGSGIRPWIAVGERLFGGHVRTIVRAGDTGRALVWRRALGRAAVLRVAHGIDGALVQEAWIQHDHLMRLQGAVERGVGVDGTVRSWTVGRILYLNMAEAVGRANEVGLASETLRYLASHGLTRITEKGSFFEDVVASYGLVRHRLVLMRLFFIVA